MKNCKTCAHHHEVEKLSCFPVEPNVPSLMDMSALRESTLTTRSSGVLMSMRTNIAATSIFQRRRRKELILLLEDDIT